MASASADNDAHDPEKLDPEIEALLDFEPVPVRKRVNGWDAAAQRAFVAALVETGSKLHAAEALGRNLSSIERLMNGPRGTSLKAAVERAMAIAEQRSGAFLAKGVQAAARSAHRDPFPRRGRRHSQEPAPLLPGQVYNEVGEPEDEESFVHRGEEAKDSISVKLQRARRLFLYDISDDPAQRAAFEILTRLPIDWDKAAQCLPQDDEPWRKPSMRDPEMLLSAEAGWLGGELVHGEDKKAELLNEINEWRAERGMEPVGWNDE